MVGDGDTTLAEKLLMAADNAESGAVDFWDSSARAAAWVTGRVFLGRLVDLVTAVDPHCYSGRERLRDAFLEAAAREMERGR